jgi:RNA polymerase sigma factor (sigma-70 family)
MPADRQHVISRLLPGLGPDGSDAAIADGQLLERFLRLRDEAAFAVLVRRHGPMVQGVGRRILGNAADADDVFQATFVVLVREAPSLIGRPVLGGFLHDVARRAALNARRALADRRRKERRAARPEAQAEAGRNDWLPLLDEELSRLPGKYRLPLVLCDLEARTRREAAEQLGWPEGTVAGRLARGRALLAKRLIRRARTLAGTVAGALAERTVQAAVAPPLVRAAVQAARLLAAGEGTTPALSAEVLTLAHQVVRSLRWDRTRSSALALLVALVVTSAAGLSLCALAADGPPQATAGAGKAPHVKDSPQPRPDAGDRNDPDMLRFVLTLDKDRYDAGEPIVVTARVTNGGKTPLEIELTSDATGQLDGYSFQVRNGKGELLKGPGDRATRPLSMLGSTQAVAPGHTSTRDLTLNYWVPPLRQGKYSVKGVYQPGGGKRDVRAESQAASFEVLDTPPADLRERVSRLTRELREGANGDRIAPLLGFTGQPEAIQPLTDLLYADADPTAVAAADALLSLDRNRVKNALLESLKIRGPRERLVELLSNPLKAKPEEVTPVLVSWLEDKNGDARAAAVEGLRLFNQGKDAGLFPKLARRLEDALPQVRLRAAAAVGEYQDAAGLKALKGVVHDRDPGVAEQAVIAVGWVAAAAKPGSATRAEAIDLLRSLLTSEGAPAKQAAYWLGKLDGK